MPAPIFSLATSGTDPKATTSKVLEDEVNRVIGITYDQANPEDATAAADSADAAAGYAGDAATAKNLAQVAAIAAGAPLVTTLTDPVPANDTVEILQTSAGGQVWQVVGGAWSLVGWVVKPEFATIAEMAAASGFADGQEVAANGERFKYISASTLTADGALVVSATGMGSGRLISQTMTLPSIGSLLLDDPRGYETYAATEAVYAGATVFTVAPEPATDQDEITSGGVKLYYSTLGYSQDRTQYRTQGGAVRQTAASGGWSFINDAGHEPFGLSSAAVSGVDLRVTADFTADEVGAFICQPDETFSAWGLNVGPSVGQNITDISGFAPVSGPILAGTSGISYNTQVGNVTSQVVDQSAGTITIAHGSQSHTSSYGTAVSVTPAYNTLYGEFQVESQTKTGFVLQYTTDLACRITCTTETPSSEVFTVSQTNNTGVTAAWNAAGFLRVTHPAIGNNSPKPIITLHKNSAVGYQFKVDAGSTTTDIYFLNADGTAVSAASANMIINFAVSGNFPASIPSGTTLLGNVQRDMVPVDFDQLHAASGNLWIFGSHPV